MKNSVKRSLEEQKAPVSWVKHKKQKIIPSLKDHPFDYIPNEITK